MSDLQRPKPEGEGLHEKYIVIKKLSDNTERIVPDCFVLRPESDPVARDAIRYYARAVQNATLERNLMNWMDEIDGMD